MTQQQLDEIRERCDKATPGEWFVDRDVVRMRGLCGERGHEDCAVCQFFAIYHESADKTKADMAFIAHARTDIPALLDDNERLRAALERLGSMQAMTPPFGPDSSLDRELKVRVHYAQQALCADLDGPHCSDWHGSGGVK